MQTTTVAEQNYSQPEKDGIEISQSTWEIRIGPKWACNAGGFACRTNQFIDKISVI